MRAICVRVASCPWSNIFLAAGTIRATHARESKPTSDDNQFLGVVGFSEGVIVELELGIDKKSTNMRLKILTEAELAEEINKYLHSSHQRDNFGGLVRLSEPTIEAVLTAGGRSDSKIHVHANCNSKARSTTLLD